MAKLYLDSDVIVKRYIAEKGSQSVAEIYQNMLRWSMLGKKVYQKVDHAVNRGSM